jgi:hypothetical protein
MPSQAYKAPDTEGGLATGGVGAQPLAPYGGVGMHKRELLEASTDSKGH